MNQITMNKILIGNWLKKKIFFNDLGKILLVKIALQKKLIEKKWPHENFL